MSDKADVLKAAVGELKDKKPLIYAATAANADALGALAKEAACPLAVKGDGSLDSVIALTEKLTGMGLKDLVIDTGSRELKKGLRRTDPHPPCGPQGPFPSLGFPDHHHGQRDG